MSYRFKVKGRTYRCETLKACSDIYSAIRDQSGLGASKMREGRVFENGKQVARVSYNGRVWAGANPVADATPLYDNRAPVPAPTITAIPSILDYNGYKIAAIACFDTPLVAVFDPRFLGDAALYKTTSLDLAMRWIDAYRAGHQWAVTARFQEYAATA